MKTKKFSFWVFHNKWYYIFPIFGILVLHILLIITGEELGILPPPGLGIGKILIGLIIAIPFYYFLWLIPFRIYWLAIIKKEKRSWWGWISPFMMFDKFIDLFTEDSKQKTR
ncbi:MAG: hypothetical protein ABIH59_03325 [archaeon]